MFYFAPNISWQCILNEIFVFEEISGELYVFKKYSKDIWLYIDEGFTTKKIVNCLSKKYSISLIDARNKLVHCIKDFKGKKLIIQENDNATTKSAN